MKSKGRLIYITEHGSKIGISGERLYVTLKNCNEKKFFNLIRLEGIIIGANVSVSSRLLSALPEHGITCIFLDSINRFSAKIEGRRNKNVFVRKYQARISSDPDFILKISRKIVAAKIESMSQCYFDNDIHSKRLILEKMQQHDQILGVEGAASRIYFKHLRKDLNKLSIPFLVRSYYPPEDEGNALLSLAYTLLMSEVSIIINLFDMDLGWGMLHRDFYARDGLICDMMEPFRSIYADRYVLEFVKAHTVSVDDFSKDGKGVVLSNADKKRLFYKQFREDFMTEQRRDEILFFVRDIYNDIIEDGSIFFEQHGLSA